MRDRDDSTTGSPAASAPANATPTPVERMRPLGPTEMTEAQRAAAEELTAGPRGGVRGPFIPLLRSPELLRHLRPVGDYLRFGSVLEPRIRELLVLLVSRQWTQQFEWGVHRPLAEAAGLSGRTLAALADGRRPAAMADDEQAAYDLAEELIRTHGVSDETYGRAAAIFGEQGIVEIVGILGYFTTMAMVLNVAHTPPEGAPGLAAFPR
ncbi:MAG TPA: carboxymuconolactone decarboxylase family protein [Candidatus Tectomicrobia bacterium]|nr:carboxymuconolactone decarboxylase family protein [Candidatus Tectomicrobia bacterium]